MSDFNLLQLLIALHQAGVSKAKAADTISFYVDYQHEVLEREVYGVYQQARNGVNAEVAAYVKGVLAELES